MKKPSDLSLQMAARCWCDEETSDRVMDEKLAIAFAKRIDKLIHVIKLADKAHWTNPPILELESILKSYNEGTI